MATDLMEDHALWDLVNSELASANPIAVDAWNEIVSRWHQSQQQLQASQQVQTQQVQAQQVPAHQPAVSQLVGTLASSKVKLSPPASFDGTSKNLSNFLFSVRTYAGILGISMETEQVKLAVTLLEGRALTWWRSVASEAWATLGICDWANFEYRISEQFRDLNHVLRMRRDLAKQKQTGSVQAYNSAFRDIWMEIKGEMSAADALFQYLGGLKENVQAQVMLQNPKTVAEAMVLADRADSAFWFAGVRQKPAGNFAPAAMQLSTRQQQLSSQSQQQRQPIASRRPPAAQNNPVPMDLGQIKNFDQRRCFHCGQNGHIVRQCPFLQSSMQSMQCSTPPTLQGASDDQDNLQLFQATSKNV